MALALAAVLLAAPAGGLRLEWEAPAACPDAAGVRARVVGLVGAEAAAQTQLAASGVVRAQGERWALALTLVRDGGRDLRTLTDADCRALAEAAALVIAVAIDPHALPGAGGGSLVPLPPGGDGAGVPGDMSRGTGAGVPGDMSRGTGAGVPGDMPPGTGAPGDTSRGTGAGDTSRGTGAGVTGDMSRGTGADVLEDMSNGAGPSVTRAPVPADRSGVATQRLHVGLRVGAGVGFARLLPGPHAALDLGLGLEGRGWRVEFAGGFVPPVRGTAASDAAIGGRFRLGFAEVRGCGVPGLRRAPVVFPLCVGVQLGAMFGRGEGEGLEVHEAARSLWAATRVGAALRWRPRGGRVGLWLGVDAIVALTRPKFVTAGGVLVHEAARVGGQVGVGVEVRLR